MAHRTPSYLRDVMGLSSATGVPDCEERLNRTLRLDKFVGLRQRRVFGTASPVEVAGTPAERTAARIVEHLWDGNALLRANAHAVVTSGREPLPVKRDTLFATGREPGPTVQMPASVCYDASCPVPQHLLDDERADVDAAVLPQLIESVAEDMERAFIHGNGDEQLGVLQDARDVTRIANDEGGEEWMIDGVADCFVKYFSWSAVSWIIDPEWYRRFVDLDPCDRYPGVQDEDGTCYGYRVQFSKHLRTGGVAVDGDVSSRPGLLGQWGEGYQVRISDEVSLTAERSDVDGDWNLRLEVWASGAVRDPEVIVCFNVEDNNADDPFASIHAALE